MRSTWRKPTRTAHGDLDTKDRKALPDNVYAFPKQRKEPLTEASHVRTALARFDQVQEVSDADRELAFANIKRAAKEFGVDIEEKTWHDLGKRPHTRNPSKD
jgi:hypothetical protein